MDPLGSLLDSLGSLLDSLGSLLDSLGILLGTLGSLLDFLGSLLGTLAKPSWIPWKPFEFLDEGLGNLETLGSSLGETLSSFQFEGKLHW